MPIARPAGSICNSIYRSSGNIPTPSFHLVTEDAFHTSYLLAEWQEACADKPGYGGIAIRAECPSTELLTKRVAFHAKYHDQKTLPDSAWALLDTLYPPLSNSEKAMIQRYGIPSLPKRAYDDIKFIGKNINSERAITWLQSLSDQNLPPRFYLFLDQILKDPAWLDAAHDGRVFNAHSAVLPYAAGMYAIENVAALNDHARLAKAAGATVHYIDPGVDSGNIIRTKSLPVPFQFDSIWDVKGASYKAAFGLLKELAASMAQAPEWKPWAYVQDKTLCPHVAFKAKDFTLEKRAQAEMNYHSMRQRQVSSPPPPRER